jgi:phosphoglycerate dehydrogenase-like enzyme
MPKPAVLYLDLDGLDVRLGHALLQQNGVDVLDIADAPAQEDLERVVAVLAGYGEVGAELMARLPALRIVATHSAGVDMVDTEALRARGLWLANLPGGATDEVAAHALAMALALVRRLPHYDREVRAGRWLEAAVPVPQLPHELTLGIVGMGQIGRRLAAMAAPLFGSLVGHDPGCPPDLWPYDVQRLESVDEVFAASGCVSLHLPLTPRTRHLVDRRRLGLLPPGAVLVNVSRGELVDETALVEALADGRLAGAGSDVLAHEPPLADDPMLHSPGVLLSPHVGYLSAGALRRYAEVPAANVVELLRHGRPLHPVLEPTTRGGAQP